ncbi:MAG: hypothetical protein J0H75_15210 [Rhizobiales bacterium]|nr:hypothetical protein [Hyphomicrobiales bacterium]
MDQFVRIEAARVSASGTRFTSGHFYYMKQAELSRRTRNLLLLLLAGVLAMIICKTFPYSFSEDVVTSASVD